MFYIQNTLGFWEGCTEIFCLMNALDLWLNLAMEIIIMNLHEKRTSICQSHFFFLKVRLWYQLCHNDTTKSLPLWHEGEESHWLWAGSPPPFPALDVRTVPPSLRECLLQPHDNAVSCNFPAKSKSHSAHISMRYMTFLGEQILH